ncbi:MAG: DUF342 domain-containing protein [Chitinivibrionales bacterium]|nr:DUF342 domain-containing protein [Chitinivibrionales bacterium]
MTTACKDRISCTISEDAMIARLSIEEPGEEPAPITVQDVIHELEHAGIVYGIDEEIIKISVDFYNEYGQGESEAVVARGVRPVDGRDGRIECLLDVNKPVVTHRKDGKILHRQKDTMPSVKKGRPLFRRVPPTRAVDGKTVTGITLSASRGTWRQLPKITNTEALNDDPNTLVSSIDGCAIKKNDSVKILPYREIRGDVNEQTGSIVFDGAVKVMGDVKSGYSVDARGCVFIYGNVEDAHIKSEGDVIIKGGFNGTGKGKIECSGDVEVGYVHKQHITAMGAVRILYESIDASLYSRKKIHVTAGEGTLSGGKTYALKGIECLVLGSESETKTEVSIGLSPAIRKKLENFNTKISELGTKRNYYAKQLEQIERSKKKSKELFEKLIDKMEKIMEAKMGIDMEYDEIVKKKNIFAKQFSIDEPPVLKVAGKCCAGVVLSFSGFNRIIEEKVEKREFYLDKGKIADRVITAE